MAEGDTTLRDIRKETVEARNLAIKTHTLIESLGGDLRVIGKRQETFGRRVFINSVLGYLMLLGVISASLYYVFDSRVDRAREGTAEADARAKTLEGKLAALQAKATARERAGQTALVVHQALQERKDLTAAATTYTKLSAGDLDPVARRLLQDEAGAVFRNEALKSFEEGRNQARRARYADSLPHLNRAIALAPLAAFAAEAHWRRGYALHRTDNQRKAIPDFERVIEIDSTSEFADDAAYHLAYALEMLGEKERALAAYRLLLDRFPRSDKAGISKRKVDQLDKQTQDKEKSAAPAGTR